MKKIKDFLKNNPRLAVFGAVIYNFFFRGKKKIKGDRNYLYDNKAFLYRGVIEIYGEENIVEIGEFSRMRNCHIYIRGNKNIVKIGKECVANELEIWIEDDGNQVEIGHNTWVTGKTHMAVTEGTKLILGEKCLLAQEVVIRTGDSHSILDPEGNRVNTAKDVNIGEHVWLGNRCTLLKGVKIGTGSVIGTGAIVTKNVPLNCVVAGNPAKVVKENINWISDRI